LPENRLLGSSAVETNVSFDDHEALDRLCKRCVSIAEELIRRLDDLKVKERKVKEGKIKEKEVKDRGSVAEGIRDGGAEEESDHVGELESGEHSRSRAKKGLPTIIRSITTRGGRTRNLIVGDGSEAWEGRRACNLGNGKPFEKRWSLHVTKMR
jgi:hypothetical protein